MKITLKSHLTNELPKFSSQDEEHSLSIPSLADENSKILMDGIKNDLSNLKNKI